MTGLYFLNSLALLVLVPVIGFVGMIVVWFLVLKIAQKNKLSVAEARKQAFVYSLVYAIAGFIAFVWFVASGTLVSVGSTIEERYHFARKYYESNLEAEQKLISK